MAYVIRNSYTPSASSNYVSLYSSNGLAQTFTPAISYTVSQIALRLKQYAAGDKIWAIRLYLADAGHLPTGSPLGEFGTITYSGVTSSYVIYYFNGASVPVTAGTRYAIVMEPISGSTGGIYWFSKWPADATPYAGQLTGKPLSAWDIPSGYEDCSRWFRAYSTAPVITLEEPGDAEDYAGTVFSWSINDDSEVSSYSLWFEDTDFEDPDPNSPYTFTGITELSKDIAPSTLIVGHTYWWWVNAYDAIGTLLVSVDSFTFTVSDAISKPINPTPTDATGNIRANLSAVTWEDGGGAETFDVYFGFSPEGLVLTQEDVPVDTPTITSPYVQMDMLCEPLVFGGTNRLPVAGDVLTDSTTEYTVWKVQRGGLIDFSYTAKLYAYRVGAPVVNKDLTRTPSPDDNGETVRVHINGETGYLRPDKTLYWRVDAKAGATTVEGDVWSFGTWRGPTNPRSDDYDPDSQWQYDTGDGAYGWYDIDVAGGGRYKPHLVIVAHKSIYFT